MQAAYHGNELYIGTDEPKPAYAVLNHAGTLAIDISGWAFSWMLKRLLSDADSAALIVKTTALAKITIIGSFNADPDLSTQRVVVDLEDTDTDALDPGYCYGELKRVESGMEHVIDRRKFLLVRSVHRS